MPCRVTPPRLDPGRYEHGSYTGTMAVVTQTLPAAPRVSRVYTGTLTSSASGRQGPGASPSFLSVFLLFRPWFSARVPAPAAHPPMGQLLLLHI